MSALKLVQWAFWVHHIYKVSAISLVSAVSAVYLLSADKMCEWEHWNKFSECKEMNALSGECSWSSSAIRRKSAADKWARISAIFVVRVISVNECTEISTASVLSATYIESKCI